MMPKNSITALAVLCALATGCATEQEAPTTLDQLQAKGWIKEVNTKHRPPNTTWITYKLVRDPLDASDLGLMRSGLPPLHLALRSTAMGAAQHYWLQHTNEYVMVEFIGPDGKILEMEDAGSPTGWHEEQTGYDFQTDECGRLQVYPHFERKPDQ
jgi:hypothetical protein